MLIRPKIRDGSALLLFFLLCLGTNFNAVAVTTDCTQTRQTGIPQNQCQALIDLYTSTNGASWTDNATNKWNTDNFPCSWTGVTCSRGNSGVVKEVDRSGQNLVGTIPASLSNLTSLTQLRLSNNQLKGSIPTPLLTSLTVLLLDNNLLEGTIPTPLPTGLTTLYLHTNQLKGTIPALPSGLTNCDLGGNQFTGTIPTPLPSGLTNLRLGYNQLTGSIPALPSGLTQLWLNKNQLSGTIPTLPTRLIRLYLQNNMFTGTLPSFASLNSLTSPYLDVSYNALTGTYPDETTVVSGKQSNWDTTQTVAVTHVTATSLSSSSVQLNWTPITYTADGGYYQVKYATTPDGTYTNATSTTANKSASTYTVTGLSPSTLYYFVVETVTPAHDLQQNELSTLSSAVSATTSTCSSTITVTSTADDSTVGTLRYAINNLCPNGIVDFASSLANQTITLGSKITFAHNITLQNPNAAGLKISGNNAIQMFHIEENVTVTIDKLNIVNGKSGDVGSSGGAFVNYGTLNFTNGKCSNNQSLANGGCIINYAGATLNFISSVCEQNQTTTSGGCIYNEGSLAIQGSVLDNNKVTAGDGGAIFSNSGTVTVTRSTFSQNSAATYGGAIRNDASFTASNSTFFDNTSSGSGAIHNSDTGIMTLTNNTIAGNSSYGVMNNASGTLHLKNNIIANNSSTDCLNNGTLATNLSNLIKDNSCSPALSGDPLLATGLSLNGAPTGYPLTLELLPNSPAINAGDAGTCADSLINNVDERNFPRSQGSACDLGAFEAPPPAAPSAFKIQSISDTSLQLSWTDNSSNETGFKIERDGTLLSTTVANITSYTDLTVTCDKTYTYRLFSFNNVNNSSVVTATFFSPCTPTTSVAGYQSQPTPDTTLDFGMTAVNMPIQKTLKIQEIGDAALIINSVKITGTDTTAFSIVPPTASFFIANGGAAYTLTLQCLPIQAITVSATLELSTNDPNYPTVTYPLSCTGVKDSVNLTLTTYGSGKITASGSGKIEVCEENCTLIYPQNSTTNLIATPEPGWQFSRWSDECPSGQVVMTGDKNCTAYFIASSNAVTLTITTTGQGMVAGCGQSCTQAHVKDNTVNLTATPAIGWQLSNWSGDCVNGQVVMNADKTCTANFTAPTTTPTTGIPIVAPISGTANGSMSNYNQTAVDLTVAPNGSVSGGTLAGTVTNNGLIANVTIASGATVTGGKFSGFNINYGTLTDITLSPFSEIRGGSYSGTIHNEGVIMDPTILPSSTFYGGKVGGVVLNQGVLQDVTFLPETLILGGTLSGNMVGDASGYVIIGEANLTKIKLARACLTMTVQLGDNVQLDKTVIRHPLIPIIDAEVEDFCIQPESIPRFTKQRILGTEKLAFQAFEPENVAELPPLALEALIAEQFANFRPDSLSALTVEQYRHIPLTTFKGLHKDNLGGFSPQVMAQFDTSHFNELQGVEFQQMPGFGIAKWLTNLNKSQLTAELLEKFIPNTWQLDEITGIFTAPADTQLAMKRLEVQNLPENVNLPPYQFDINSTFSLSGDADAETLLQKINRALRVQGIDYQAEQTQQGVILSKDVKNKRQFAFMLNSQKLLQRAETATVGAQMTEAGEYQVLTVDDIEVNLSPAPKDPVILAKTLGAQSHVTVGERGDVFLNQAAVKSRRVRDGDFVYVVMIFDPFIEPSFSDICHVNEFGETVCDWDSAAAAMQPGLHFYDEARAKQQAQFIYPDGTTQKLYPTVFAPDTFIAEAKKFPGVEAVQFNMDGTFEVTYQGQKLQLFPNFAVTVTELEKYQQVKPSVTLTSTGVAYQVQHGQQLLTSELSFGQ